MKLQDLLEYTDMVDMDDNYDSHRVKNPLPNVMSMEDPLFGEAFDAMDEAVYTFIFQNAEQEAMYKQLPPRQKAAMVKEMTAQLSKQTKLPIASLISTEPTIDKRHIEALKTGTTQHKGNPSVFKYKGKNFIEDGNHRVIAAHLAGEKDVTVNFLDIDAIS